MRLPQVPDVHLSNVVVERDGEKVLWGPRPKGTMSGVKALCRTKMMMRGDTHFGWSERHRREGDLKSVVSAWPHRRCRDELAI